LSYLVESPWLEASDWLAFTFIFFFFHLQKKKPKLSFVSICKSRKIKATYEAFLALSAQGVFTLVFAILIYFNSAQRGC
jgi:hypothetical protein